MAVHAVKAFPQTDPRRSITCSDQHPSSIKQNYLTVTVVEPLADVPTVVVTLAVAV